MINKTRFSVSEISDILKTCFDNPMFSSISVFGEVYSIKLGKFSYIEIGDQGQKQASSPLIKCAFSSFNHYESHLEDIKVGDVIEVKGKLSYYPHGSSITLWGNEVDMIKTQEGKNLLLKKKTLEKLEKLGYLDENRKRKIPFICKRIAILTAENGAAYQDILKTLHSRFPVDTVLYPITVQGDNAIKSIVNALNRANDSDYDAIILGRGGGSKTDLSCFDDEKVALAIANSKTPIITCIGHTIDTAIADRVSDIKAITPTEGASLINPSLDDIHNKMSQFKDTLVQIYTNILHDYEQSLDNLFEKLTLSSPINKLKEKKEKLNFYEKELNDKFKHKISDKINEEKRDYQYLLKAYQNKIFEKKVNLEKYKSILKSCDPKSIQEKGYAKVYLNGLKIKSTKDIKVDDKLIITYVDGRIKAKVEEKINE